ncbi:unnamed protein product [marine sediment metagenome]|uniref:Uncharacterized protein n=1 Tax=marine sediment metagenome TaxID=412755 RepID=X1B4P9_9ZZZZ
MDPRIEKLAKNLVNYSCKIQKGEKVLVECVGNSGIPLTRALIKEIYKTGGVPYMELKDNSIVRELLKKSTPEQLESMAKYELTRMKEMDAFIGIRAGDKLAAVSWEKNGEICCISLIKAEDFAEMVKDLLGPMMEEILKKKKDKIKVEPK